jgi:predicted TIM-barrel fold metal-dependent hydrolase
MPIIDADTHVDENDETWSFLLPEHEQYRPLTVSPGENNLEGVNAPPGYTRYWNIDGALRIRRIRDDVRTGTTEQTRELHDVAARLKQMDQLNVDIQVMYPTLFLTTFTTKAEIEYALCRSYNRWMGEKSRESDGRLRWVVVPPMLSMDRCIEELEWGKNNGACGVFKRGVEVGRSASDPYFFPLYEHAQFLNLPICIHTAAHDPAIGDTLASHLTMYNFRLSPIDAFISLIRDQIPNKFPKLRVGFIETLSSWVPYAIAELEALHARVQWMSNFDYSKDLVKKGRFYVACETHEDLPYIMNYTGDEHLIIGSDYSHADQSAELEALSILQARSDLSASTTNKIINDNPSEFYGIH